MVKLNKKRLKKREPKEREVGTMKKAEFNKKVDMAVEIEYADGYRHWTTMKGTQVNYFINNLSDDEYISDVDYSYQQEFKEIRELLDKAEDIWFNNREWWESRNMKCLDEVINALLEDDDVPAEKENKRVWTEEEIKVLVQTNDEVLYRALKKLYDCQTADEKRSGHTKEYNGKGFNSVDAKFMTSVSEFLIKVGYLTEKQKVATRKVIIKYTKQLTRIANN